MSAQASVNFVMALLARHNDEMVELRRRLAEANGGGNGERFILGYMFLDPERYQRHTKFCILITDEDEIAMVKRGWKTSPETREMAVNPEPGRICVIGSYN